MVVGISNMGLVLVNISDVLKWTFPYLDVLSIWVELLSAFVGVFGWMVVKSDCRW